MEIVEMNLTCSCYFFVAEIEGFIKGMAWPLSSWKWRLKWWVLV